MAGSHVSFNEDDATVITALVDHYDKNSRTVELAEIDVDLERDALITILCRLERYGLVECEARSYELWTIDPQLLSVADQLRTSEPPRDYWKEVGVWFRAKWWSVPVILLFLLLPLVMGYIEMVKTILQLFGALESI